MAYIPVEKKTSPLVWIIPLILVALLALGAVLLLSDDDDVEPVTPVDPVVVADEPEPIPVVDPVPVADTPEPAVAAGGVITTVTELMEGTGASVADRAVAINDLKVVEVIGDYSFYVAPTEGMTDKKIFVFLDEQPTPNSPIEGRYDVTADEVIGVTGFARLAEEKNVLATDDMVTRKELESFSDDTIYLHADKLSGVERTAEGVK